MFPHDGLDERCDSLKNLESMVGSWAVFEVGEGLDEDVWHGMGVRYAARWRWVLRSEVYNGLVLSTATPEWQSGAESS